MTSTQTAALELTQILTDYCTSFGTIYVDKEKLMNLLSKVSIDQRCDLLASMRDRHGVTVLKKAAYRGQLRTVMVIQC